MPISKMPLLSALAAALLLAGSPACLAAEHARPGQLPPPATRQAQPVHKPVPAPKHKLPPKPPRSADAKWHNGQKHHNDHAAPYKNGSHYKKHDSRYGHDGGHD